MVLVHQVERELLCEGVGGLALDNVSGTNSNGEKNRQNALETSSSSSSGTMASHNIKKGHLRAVSVPDCNRDLTKLALLNMSRVDRFDINQFKCFSPLRDDLHL